MVDDFAALKRRLLKGGWVERVSEGVLANRSWRIRLPGPSHTWTTLTYGPAARRADWFFDLPSEIPADKQMEIINIVMRENGVSR